MLANMGLESVVEPLFPVAGTPDPCGVGWVTGMLKSRCDGV